MGLDASNQQVSPLTAGFIAVAPNLSKDFGFTGSDTAYPLGLQPCRQRRAKTILIKKAAYLRRLFLISHSSHPTRLDGSLCPLA